MHGDSLELPRTTKDKTKNNKLQKTHKTPTKTNLHKNISQFWTHNNVLKYKLEKLVTRIYDQYPFENKSNNRIWWRNKYFKKIWYCILSNFLIILINIFWIFLYIYMLYKLGI